MLKSKEVGQLVENQLRAVVTWQGQEYTDEMEWEYRGECNREADFLEHSQEHGSW